MAQRPSDNPILRRHIFLRHSRFQLRDFLTPAQALRQNAPFWSREVHQAITCVVFLLAQWQDARVDVRPQETIREFRNGVSEIDDCVAGKRLELEPLCVAARLEDS